MRHLFLFLALAFLSFSLNATAQIDFTKDDAVSNKPLFVTGFTDYPPFGDTQPNYNLTYFDSALIPFIEDYAKKFNFNITYIYNQPYQKNLQQVQAGKIDVVLGIYADSDPHNELELVYPSIISNPIVVVTMPGKKASIQTIDDLKNLKGAIGAYEYLSEFVKSQIKQYNIQQISTPYHLYKGLYTGEFDYVLASAYNGRIVLAKLGLTGQLSISNNAIWNMPLFIGISKLSGYRDQIRRGLSQLAEKKETNQSVLDNISKIIHNYENQYQGVVAPNFFAEN